MKKALVILSIILVLVQLSILTTINFLEKEFITTSITIGNDKVQEELDNDYDRFNKLFQFSKNISSNYIEDLDKKLEALKDFVKSEMDKLTREINSGVIDYREIEDVEFDLLKLIEDKEFAVIYFKSHLIRSLKSLRNDLNIMFCTNILILSIIIVIALKSDENKIGAGLSWIALASVLISSLIYFFEQNWLYSLLMNSYYGYIYAVLVGIIFLILVDIAFNRGRVIGNLLMEVFFVSPWNLYPPLSGVGT